jgi:hypothetical protein
MEKFISDIPIIPLTNPLILMEIIGMLKVLIHL